MSCFGRKTIQFVRSLGHTTSNASFARMRWFSISSDSEESRKHTFTVSFLMNSLGFSKNKALLASKTVGFESSEKPEKCIEFFESYGLTGPQIADLVRNYPRALLCDVDKIFLPKLEFLNSKGLSGPDLASILSKFPRYIKSSLAKQIVPSYDFWKSVLGSDSKTVMALKRSPDILTYSLENNVSPNIECLRRNGVTVSHIFTIVLNWPRIIARCPDEFREAVERVAEMGFDPLRIRFVQALFGVLVKKSTWDRKAKAYKKWGWSEEELLFTFKRDPRCMCSSVDRIEAGLGFFVGEAGLKPKELVKSPSALCYSLKRVKLRYSVLGFLSSKGLLKHHVSVLRLACYTEAEFARMFLRRYAEQAPEILDMYKRKARLPSDGECGPEFAQA